MYESYFGFKDTPFRLSADEKFRYAHKNYLRASAYLAYAMEQGEGIVMITGQPGSGKTTLIRDVISELDETSYSALNIVTSQLHAEELLRKMALEFGIPAENASKATLLTNIHKHLSSLHEQGKRSILFLDEAQNLSLNGLEELRLLSNLQQGKHSLLQIVLVGHNELRQLVLGPDMQHVQQRLIASCQIDPLTQEQTREYIIHRLRHVDWQEDPKIDDEVYQLIHLASQGVPRNINHLMSQMLLFVCLEEKHQMTDEDALSVIEELIDQQRISLANEECFESFADNYREQKQQQVRHHAVASASVYSLTPHESDTWNNQRQKASTPPPHIVSTLHTLDSDNIQPAAEAVSENTDSDWLMWHEGTADELETETMPADEAIESARKQSAASDSQTTDYGSEFNDPAEPLLPDADDIWNGTLESSDMETLFPSKRRQKSAFSVDRAEEESSSEQLDEAPSDKRGDRWGGVWFMSSVSNQAQPHQRSTITVPPRPSAPTQKKNHNITVDENLSMPSVWVDGCPEIAATEPDHYHQQPRKPGKSGIVKRSLMHVLALVSIGLMIMLAIRLFPDQFNNLLPARDTRGSSADNTMQDTSVPQQSIDAQDRPAPESASVNRETFESIAPHSSPIAQANAESVNGNVAMLNEGIAHQSQPQHKTDQPQISEAADNTASIGSVAPELNDSVIESHHHIDLATRYFVYFDFNDFTLPATHESLLKSIRDKMLLEENNYLKITGYADSQGNVSYNRGLSLKRAEAVKRFFTVRGIPDERLKVSAVGAVSHGDPKYESIDNRRLIRRVEVILFPK